MSEATAADRQKAFLDKARKLYSDSKFKAALVAFKEAGFQYALKPWKTTR